MGGRGTGKPRQGSWARPRRYSLQAFSSEQHILRTQKERSARPLMGIRTPTPPPLSESQARRQREQPGQFTTLGSSHLCPFYANARGARLGPPTRGRPAERETWKLSSEFTRASHCDFLNRVSKTSSRTSCSGHSFVKSSSNPSSKEPSVATWTCLP